ncbi:MAG: DnaD domain protein [Lachnospiraceae bacterium]|nr:DnaD domain protein [Lachnospiraceae bacterium]
MGNFRIYQDNYADFTVVSNVFIDEYMEDANDAQLKIYLYLMRMLNADLATGVSDIADRFNYTEKDVMRALRYWEKKGILKLDYDSSKTLTGVHMLSLCEKQTAEKDEEEVMPAEEDYAKPAPASVSMTIVRPQSATVTDIADYSKPQFSKDDLISFKSRGSQLVFIAEQYMHKTLTPADLTTLLFLSETLHFSDDLIDYLLQYCVGRGKTSHRYIETVAIDWAESGITTPDEAKIYTSKFDIAYDIMRALGKNNTDPSTVELELINKWTKEYGFGIDVIKEACSRTVLATDRARFKYADSILTRWFELGIHELPDIDKKDPPRKKASSGSGSQEKNRFNQFAQNTYNFSELEKKLIKN